MDDRIAQLARLIHGQSYSDQLTGDGNGIIQESKERRPGQQAGA
jgi:hypothetical protein